MAEYGSREFNLEDRTKDSQIKDRGSQNNFDISFFDSDNPRRLKIPLKAKLIFFRQLSVILQSGVPLAQGLDLLSENVNKKFSKCIDNISKDLGSGLDLSIAFQNYPRIFDPIIVGLIQAGEAGGILSKVLERIAIMKSKIVKDKLQTLIYPVILLA